MESIKFARKTVSARLSACIVMLENGQGVDFVQHAHYLFEAIGFIRGRTNDQRSKECRTLHRMKEAVCSQDLTALWEVEKDWAEMGSYRK